jgi:hypothetical protein
MPNPRISPSGQFYGAEGIGSSVRVERAAAQVIAAGAWATVDLTAIGLTDALGVLVPDLANDRVQVQRAMRALVTWSGGWDGGAGVRELAIWDVTGAPVQLTPSTDNDQGAAGFTAFGSYMLTLASGNLLALRAQQATGGPINVTGAQFSIIQV